jgi:nitrate reductase molybdenum cofactor assembly chaperone NarJ/NarW
MEAASVVALGFSYPAPQSRELLMNEIEVSLRGVCRRQMRRFYSGIECLKLGEWEELHTRTVDLSPLFVPYVGHVVWGDNYRRGEFMADLKGEMTRLGVELGGELPDHIEPILRYLSVAPEPMVDLLEVLPEAVGKMRDTLEAADKSNPYSHLLGAVVAVVEDLKSLQIGTVR